MVIHWGSAYLIGFFFWVLSARYYSAEDMGLASATISALVLTANIADLGLGFGLIRFLPGFSDKKGFINTCFTLAFFASVLAGIVFLAGLNIWSPALLFLRNNPFYIAFFCLYIILSSISVMSDKVFIALRQVKFSFIRSLVMILEIPLVIALAPLLGAAGILLATGVAVGISVACSLFLFLPRIQRPYFPWPTLHWEVITRIFRYSIGNHLSWLLLYTPNWVLPLLVVNRLGPEQNAYFYISWTVGVTVVAIFSSISYSLFAEGSHDEKRLFSLGISAFKLSLLLLVPVITLIFIGGSKLLLLFGPVYSEQGTGLLRLLALSALPASFNHIYITYKRVTKELRVVVGISGAIALLALGGSYLLLPRLGLIGPGWAYLGAHTLIASWLVIHFLLRDMKN